jgi:phosphoglycerate dehydrogenase-like enzyme
VTGRRPVVVALGTVDPALVTGVLGDSVEFVAQPGPEELAKADGAIVRADAVVDAALLARAPRLRVLARTGVGVDLVDVDEAGARGIAVVITPDSGTRAVAEGVLAHALHLVKRLAPLTRVVREGRWAERAGIAVGDLDGATIGIIGYGRIGRRVGELAAAFGMRVLAHDPLSPPPAEVDCPDLGELAGASDLLTLHVPLTEATDHLVDAGFLRRTRPGAILVNCGRGGLLDLDAALAAELQATGATVRFVQADVADVAQAQGSVATVAAELGRVDCLVNAAGLTARGSLLDTTPELFDAHIAVNLRAPFFLMQAAVKDMQARKAPGTIVNIISSSELGGQPYLAPYVAAKAGLAGLTRNAAHAHRWDRIRVNGLDIGWTETEGEDATQRTFHEADDTWRERAARALPMGKLGQVDEIADFVVFLLSDRSGVVTGSVIDWDQNVFGALD